MTDSLASSTFPSPDNYRLRLIRERKTLWTVSDAYIARLRQNKHVELGPGDGVPACRFCLSGPDDEPVLSASRLRRGERCHP